MPPTSVETTGSFNSYNTIFNVMYLGVKGKVIMPTCRHEYNIGVYYHNLQIKFNQLKETIKDFLDNNNGKIVEGELYASIG